MKTKLLFALSLLMGMLSAQQEGEWLQQISPAPGWKLGWVLVGKTSGCYLEFRRAKWPERTDRIRISQIDFHNRREKEIWQFKGSFFCNVESCDTGVYFGAFDSKGFHCLQASVRGDRCQVEKCYHFPANIPLESKVVFPVRLIGDHAGDARFFLDGGKNDIVCRWEMRIDDILFHEEWRTSLPLFPKPEYRHRKGKWQVLFHPKRALIIDLPALQAYSLELLCRQVEAVRAYPSPDELRKTVGRYFLAGRILDTARLPAQERAHLEGRWQKLGKEMPLFEVSFPVAGKNYRCLVSSVRKNACFLPQRIAPMTINAKSYPIGGMRTMLSIVTRCREFRLAGKVRRQLEKKLFKCGISNLRYELPQPLSCCLPADLSAQFPSLAISCVVLENRLRFFFWLNECEEGLLRAHLKIGLPLRLQWSGRLFGLFRGTPQSEITLRCENILREISEESYTILVAADKTFWCDFPEKSCEVQVHYQNQPTKTIQLTPKKTERNLRFPLERDEKGEPIYRFAYRQKDESEFTSWQTSEFPCIFLRK